MPSSRANTATERTPLRESSTCDAALRARVLTFVASIAEGYDIAVMANALPPMIEEFSLSPLMVGIIVSSLLFAAMVASLFTGTIVDSLGRKTGIAIASALLAAGNICWALAPNVVLVLTGRILLGLGIGLGIATITMYMSEVSPANRRGLFVSLEEFVLNVGMSSALLVGWMIAGMHNDWRIMVGIAAVLPAVTCIIAFTPYLKESPRYLQSVGRKEEAREILLELLHGDEDEVDKAFAKWAEEERNGQQGMSWSSTMSAFFGSHSKQAIAATGLGFCFFLTGATCILNYSIPVLIQSGMSKKEASFAMLLWGIAKLAALIPVLFLLDRWGRRPLMLTSTVIMACGVGLAAFSVHAHLGGLWVAVGFITFAIGFSTGIAPVFYVYVAEVFDNSIRAKAVSFVFAVRGLVGAVIVLVFPALTAAWGTAEAYGMFAVINTCLFVFIWVFCPETLGVPLEEVNDIFNNPGHKGPSKI